MELKPHVQHAASVITQLKERKAAAVANMAVVEREMQVVQALHGAVKVWQDRMELQVRYFHACKLAMYTCVIYVCVCLQLYVCVCLCSYLCMYACMY